MSVSFIIPSFNSHQTLAHTLKSIFTLKSLEYVKEVIVVDSSDDGITRELLRDFHVKETAISTGSGPGQGAASMDKLKLVFLASKASAALGRNRGANQAKGELLCFIDSDVLLDPNWLCEVLEAYKNGCAIGSGSISVPDFQQDSKLALAQLYLQFNEYLDAGDKRTVTMVPACNIFVDRQLFEKIGSFPDIRASEDVLLCLKLAEIDKIWFLPKARCFHIFRESLDHYFDNQRVLGKYIIVYRRMIYNSWYYKNLWPVIFLPGFLLIKITRIKWRIFKSGWRHYSKFIICSPLFISGLWFWAVGFGQGCFLKDEDVIDKN